MYNDDYISSLNLDDNDDDLDEYLRMRNLQRSYREEGFDFTLSQVQDLQDSLRRGLREAQQRRQFFAQSIEEVNELLSSGDVEVGICKLRELSRMGYSTAWYMLGEFYLTGKYVDRNYFYALYYLTKADSRGIDEATVLLAECFSKGLGVRVNKEREKILLAKLNEEE